MTYKVIPRSELRPGQRAHFYDDQAWADQVAWEWNRHDPFLNGGHFGEDIRAYSDTEKTFRAWCWCVVKDDVASTVADGKIAQANLKVPLSFIPFKALKGCARVFGYGRKKYAPGNFLLAAVADGAMDRYISAGLRHLTDCQNLDGTWDKASMGKLDAESGLPELDHLISGLLMLRAVLIKDGVLPEDPGVGLDPK